MSLTADLLRLDARLDTLAQWLDRPAEAEAWLAEMHAIGEQQDAIERDLDTLGRMLRDARAGVGADTRARRAVATSAAVAARLPS